MSQPKSKKDPTLVISGPSTTSASIGYVNVLTLLGLGLIKINDVSANFNNPRPSLILNN
jgi:hypothetical protein